MARVLLGRRNPIVPPTWYELHDTSDTDHYASPAGEPDFGTRGFHLLMRKLDTWATQHVPISVTDSTNGFWCDLLNPDMISAAFYETVAGITRAAIVSLAGYAVGELIAYSVWVHADNTLRTVLQAAEVGSGVALSGSYVPPDADTQAMLCRHQTTPGLAVGEKASIPNVTLISSAPASVAAVEALHAEMIGGQRLAFAESLGEAHRYELRDAAEAAAVCPDRTDAADVDRVGTPAVTPVPTPFVWG